MYKFNKKAFELRQSHLSTVNCETIDLDLSPEFYSQMKELSIEHDISIEKITEDILSQSLIYFENKKTIDTDDSLSTVIDSAELITNIDEYINSNKNFLIVDYKNTNNKSVFLTEPNIVDKVVSLEK
jgi:hypothetical protein